MLFCECKGLSRAHQKHLLRVQYSSSTINQSPWHAIHLLTVLVTDVVLHLLTTSIFNIITVGSQENRSVLISY